MQPLIHCKGLTKRFPGAPEPVLDRLDWRVMPGESIAIVGASGIGKSTLLYQLGLLDTPCHGEYFFQGQPMHAQQAQWPAWRAAHMGFVFQQSYLLPKRPVLDNVLLPLLYQGQPLQEAKRQALACLEALELSPLMHRSPEALSGGQMQRVAIARALVGRPTLLLADEPTGALDPAMTTQILDYLLKKQAEEGMTLIIVTHNPVVASRCNTAYTLAGGRLHAMG